MSKSRVVKPRVYELRQADNGNTITTLPDTRSGRRFAREHKLTGTFDVVAICDRFKAATVTRTDIEGIGQSNELGDA